ncbi:hypothetical protein ASPWEDRAFT_111076 [Aspergillus wentii DTO 134E9]|uniref:CWH43-like N-terminal domain-containing protein n=1 Tax=Aspergillus wentii DTO 134E9 TaxID=1073089 RepID=A0A1L9RLD7_ASPWE|nr:uncharacterized protein ASPWEDRAFT_111076 [Aspergillus wentii DTO 134E9]OJJ35693.1 hypothetical protein ASPWEDRAFT_111076 [Aspergillus wentii DTO 134E9]
MISLLRFYDSLWPPLHAVILNIPPSRLPLFPSLAGAAWFVTLAGLILTWIAHGTPQYPGQSNPDVAFISDIASFQLKPLFLIGTSITAVCFVITVAAVHVVRYEPGFALVRCPGYNEDDMIDNNDNGINETNNSNDDDDIDEEDDNIAKTLRVISLLSIFAAGVASTALILLAIMDTFRYHHAHKFFLRICFAGLALQAAGTAIVYANEVVGFVYFLYNGGRWQHNWGNRSLRVRVFASLSTGLILLEVFLGAAFIALEEDRSYRTAGILEWIIAFLGTGYLWLFCGFFDR